ncbi:MAG: hypothetical protein Fur0046_37640 [Cyanobacteria bacterium J069]
MATWIKETDSAIYLMEGGYYLEKIFKRPRANGEKELNIRPMHDWFKRDDAPGGMVVAVGVVGPEPQPKPGTGHEGGGSGGMPKPQVTFIPAHPSNYRARREGFKINGIVFHNTVAPVQSAINTFQSSTSQVSAHYIIDRSGEIIQMVQDDYCAFHAGNKDVNDRSIGIEHEATPTQKGFTAPQEKASITLIRFLMDAYAIPKTNILAHRSVRATQCPSLIFGTDPEFQQWVTKNF